MAAKLILFALALVLVRASNKGEFDWSFSEGRSEVASRAEHESVLKEISDSRTHDRRVSRRHKNLIAILIDANRFGGETLVACAKKAFEGANLVPLTSRLILETARRYRDQVGLTKISEAGRVRDHVIADLLKSQGATRVELHAEFIKRMSDAGLKSKMSRSAFDYHFCRIQRDADFQRTSYGDTSDQSSALMHESCSSGARNDQYDALLSRAIRRREAEADPPFRGLKSRRYSLEHGALVEDVLLTMKGEKRSSPKLEMLRALEIALGLPKMNHGTVLFRAVAINQREDGSDKACAKPPGVGSEADGILTMLYNERPGIAFQDMYAALVDIYRGRNRHGPRKKDVFQWLRNRRLSSVVSNAELHHQPQADEIDIRRKSDSSPMQSETRENFHAPVSSSFGNLDLLADVCSRL